MLCLLLFVLDQKGLNSESHDPFLDFLKPKGNLDDLDKIYTSLEGRDLSSSSQRITDTSLKYLMYLLIEHLVLMVIVLQSMKVRREEDLTFVASKVEGFNARL